jgi:hypothetical protein
MDVCVVYVAQPGQRSSTDEVQKTKKKKKFRRGLGCLSVKNVMCCQVKVSATGRSLVQRNPADCGVSEVIIIIIITTTTTTIICRVCYLRSYLCALTAVTRIK